jgi:hypothetical protein
MQHFITLCLTVLMLSSTAHGSFLLARRTLVQPRRFHTLQRPPIKGIAHQAVTQRELYGELDILKKYKDQLHDEAQASKQRVDGLKDEAWLSLAGVIGASSSCLAIEEEWKFAAFLCAIPIMSIPGIQITKETYKGWKIKQALDTIYERINEQEARIRKDPIL